MSVLADELRDYRAAHRLSKAELARRAGLDTLTVWRVEQGRRCTLDTRRRLLTAMGQSPPQSLGPLRAMREDRLMSRVRLAQLSGVALRTITYIEHGHPARMTTCRRLLTALGIPLSHHRTVFGPLPKETVRDSNPPAQREAHS